MIFVTHNATVTGAILISKRLRRVKRTVDRNKNETAERERTELTKNQLTKACCLAQNKRKLLVQLSGVIFTSKAGQSGS